MTPNRAAYKPFYEFCKTDDKNILNQSRAESC